MVRIKRLYDLPEREDGFRILVDGLWPRGMKKEHAPWDQWMKSVAPSPALRKWFAHDPVKWPGFIRKYREELKQPGVGDRLVDIIKKHKEVTLLYTARDEQHNNAVVLQQFVHENLE